MQTRTNINGFTQSDSELQADANPQGSWMVIGDLDDFLPRIGRVFIVNKQEIVVFRLSDDTLRAAINKSASPKGGPLAEGLVSGNFLYDPLHDWKVDLNTGIVQAPDEGSITLVPVQLNGDQVLIDSSVVI